MSPTANCRTNFVQFLTKFAWLQKNWANSSREFRKFRWIYYHFRYDEFFSRLILVKQPKSRSTCFNIREFYTNLTTDDFSQLNRGPRDFKIKRETSAEVTKKRDKKFALRTRVCTRVKLYTGRVKFARIPKFCCDFITEGNWYIPSN